MEGIFFILLSITVLFFLLLIVKSLIIKKKEFCAICFAVGITWATFLVLYWMNIFRNNVILGILIGETTLGIFYAIEKKVKKELTLFRLPFLLSIIFIAYTLIMTPQDLVKDIVFLAVIWVIFNMVYFYQNNKTLHAFFNKIVECCKRW